MGGGRRRGLVHDHGRLEAERRAAAARAPPAPARASGRGQDGVGEPVEADGGCAPGERGDLNAAAGGGEDASRSDASLFADFRAALARALLITEEVLDREDALGDAADGDRWTENKTGTNTETAESDELARAAPGGAPRRRRRRRAVAYGRRRARRRQRRPLAAAPPVFRAAARVVHRVRRPVRWLGELRELSLVVHAKRPRVMVSPHHGRGAFDGRVAGMEAVVALEHGLLKAEASGLFAPGELLVTAVSTKDMLTCYAGGGCENVLGAPAESFIHTSLLDGLHAEDAQPRIRVPPVPDDPTRGDQPRRRAEEHRAEAAKGRGPSFRRRGRRRRRCTECRNPRGGLRALGEGTREDARARRARRGGRVASPGRRAAAPARLPAAEAGGRPLRGDGAPGRHDRQQRYGRERAGGGEETLR